VRDTLPDAFGALKYLASHPAIDPQRIGMLGFSWGAMLSVLAMDEPAAEGALGAGPRFAAHAGHYLVCAFFQVDGRATAAAGWRSRRLRWRGRWRFVPQARRRFATGQTNARRA